MSFWHAATIWLIAGITAVLLIYEVLIVAYTKDDDSLSWEIWTAAQRRPIIGVVIGILIGHWFWQMVPA